MSRTLAHPPNSRTPPDAHPSGRNLATASPFRPWIAIHRSRMSNRPVPMTNLRNPHAPRAPFSANDAITTSRILIVTTPVRQDELAELAHAGITSCTDSANARGILTSRTGFSSRTSACAVVRQAAHSETARRNHHHLRPSPPERSGSAKGCGLSTSSIRSRVSPATATVRVASR